MFSCRFPVALMTLCVFPGWSSL
uniref:Uncharacterized protein n=1 Tax=Anguilla anguilla TaxID=7936 RepID=A0A0E9Y1M1_ANGAN